MKTLIVCLLLSISINTFAQEKSSSVKIKQLIAYSKFGNGDVYLSLESNTKICAHGYFVNKDSAGFDNVYSMLVAAYHGRTPVRVYAYTESRWSGSSNPVCEIYAVMYE